MAQHDYNIENQTGLEFRADLNGALQAIATQNSGTTEPAATFPGMVWLDTSTSPPTERRRNQTDDGWVTTLTAAGQAVAGADDADAQRAAMGAQATLVSGDNIKTINGEVLLGSGNITISAGEAGTLSKADRSTPCLVKTGGGTLAIKAGTVAYLESGAVSFAAQTAVTMPALTAGEDYSVWVLPNGTAQAVADPFSSPATAPAPGALKIGGFHYGLVAPGETPASGGFSTSGFTNTGGSKVWTQADVDRIAGINEFSIWDLVFRSKGEQHGMVLDPQTRTWWGIYLCSTNHIANGVSRYNTDVASGTVLPRIPLVYGGNGTTTYGRLSLYEAAEIAASHACRLPSYEEFMSAAFGVTEGQSLGGASSTIPATARQAGYTSRIGLEQATGHHWIIGAPFGSTGGTAWSGVGRGSFYGTSGLPVFGGFRLGGPNAGSRCSDWTFAPSNSEWSRGLRAACDHYQGGF